MNKPFLIFLYFLVFTFADARPEGLNNSAVSAVYEDGKEVYQVQNTYLYNCIDSITRFVADSRNFDKGEEDLERLDKIFSYALKITDNNHSDALLALAMSLVPYRKVPIRINLLKFTIKIPLISADSTTFEAKNKNLPRRIYLDRPDNEFADTDKPAHFFGAAFIAYSLNSFEIADFIGYFVEVFEESFGLSRIDIRDIRTNRLGAEFGKLLRIRNIKPSQIFVFYNLKNIVFNI